MRSSFLLALLLAVSLAGFQWYQMTQYICPIPIEYRLGVIDDSFNITENEARVAISEAEAIWEDAVGQDLFIFDESADFTINFLFDERQETADEQTRDRERLDNIAVQNEEFKERINSLQAGYEAQQVEFESDRSEYESQLQAYNQRVQQNNDRGGARPEVFAELEAERDRLQQVSNSLQSAASELNQLAQQLNELSTEGNRLIEQYNREVEVYNRTYGEAHEFTQGDYQGGEINVYKFSDNNELVAVLAHEFGHALGIDHIEDRDGLMYYLLDDELLDTPTLAASDVEAFATTCNDQGIAGSIRSVIRQLISQF